MVEAVVWIVHPAAGMALGLFSVVLFSGRGRRWEAVAFASALLLVLAVLGAGWVAHPAAGMLLGYFGSTAFGHWRRRWPALLAALVASGFFMLAGATWLVFPLSVMGLIWLLTAAFSFVNRPAKALDASSTSSVSKSPAGLPEHAGGFPCGSCFGDRGREKEAFASTQSQRTVPRSSADAPAPSDPYTNWMRDSRLPGEARAQLVALNLRTKEALAQLHGLGQQGSEAGYLARAIREEYVPTAVNGYLKLPRTRADSVPIEGDKTGRDLLCEQLDLLLHAVQDIIDTTLQVGGRELLTHQRFLEDRFGRPAETTPSGELKV
ncbi:hypothetical protein GCM10010840_09590 [Deinococcus aerolatus]|uniref:5-bromo-4-chloroindolyl phosphate hydrolysis protein n=1 Tax=Deinococcus aerolatus TaxID=522487 RepID=A0ABQ2G3P3_9DEIO|nr:hypothetical protein [Deinococcus aerolatus]GGL73592.1 hypothetical protein GCM10010840_09590 [Deinococcus aerolatus]